MSQLLLYGVSEALRGVSGIRDKLAIIDKCEVLGLDEVWPLGTAGRLAA